MTRAKETFGWYALAVDVGRDHGHTIVDTIELNSEYLIPDFHLLTVRGQVRLYWPHGGVQTGEARVALSNILGTREYPIPPMSVIQPQRRESYYLDCESGLLGEAPFVLTDAPDASCWMWKLRIRTLYPNLLSLPDSMAALRRSRWLEERSVLFELTGRHEISDGYSKSLAEMRASEGDWVIVNALDKGYLARCAAIQLQRSQAESVFDAVLFAAQDLSSSLAAETILRRTVSIEIDGERQELTADVCEILELTAEAK